MHNRSPQQVYQLYVGIDIAAVSATAAWSMVSESEQVGVGKPLVFEQTPKGYTTLQRKLVATGIAPQQTLIVMEATSTYWIMLATHLHEEGYCVSVLNPAQAHHFAKAQLKRAKTDQLDAATLAQLAYSLKPACWTPPPAIYHQLQQRLALRDNLLGLLGQVRNQLHALLQNRVVIPSVRQHLEELIQTLSDQLLCVEAEVQEVVSNDEEWGASIVRLQSIKGVGLITATWLVVSTFNFTACPSADALTSYVGLAPMPHQSGSSVRGRPSIGHSGKERVRTALYLATLSAARYNPVIRAFYERLRAAGKCSKVARCAAARKLLHIAWALVKKQTLFDPLYSQNAAPYQSASCS
jgi:transposase